MKRKDKTPLLDAVRAQHRADDAGRDPYNTLRDRRAPVRPEREPRPGMSDAQIREAESLLACFETPIELSAAPDSSYGTMDETFGSDKLARRY
jgi:hypothetical protein